MSQEVLSLVILVIMFVLATALPINMGTLGFTAAFMFGTLVLDLDVEGVLEQFPASIFLTLAGLTFLFGIAQINGTVDLLVRGAIRLVGGRLAAIPWIMFAVTALLVGIGALFAVAIVAPIALRFAFKHRIDPLMMGMMVVHGALGGAFTPISVYGSFVNDLVGDSELPTSPLTLTVAPLLFNIAIGLVVFFLFGGRKLLSARATAPARETRDPEPVGTSAGAGASSGGAVAGSSATARAHGTDARPAEGSAADLEE